jgi:hypothetical protein
MWTDVSQEYITTILRVEYQPSTKRACSGFLGASYIPEIGKFIASLSSFSTEDFGK